MGWRSLHCPSHHQAATLRCAVACEVIRSGRVGSRKHGTDRAGMSASAEKCSQRGFLRREVDRGALA